MPTDRLVYAVKHVCTIRTALAKEVDALNKVCNPMVVRKIPLSKIDELRPLAQAPRTTRESVPLISLREHLRNTTIVISLIMIFLIRC